MLNKLYKCLTYVRSFQIIVTTFEFFFITFCSSVTRLRGIELYGNYMTISLDTHHDNE